VKGKIYPIIPDRDAQLHGMIRIVDESGEDYLFSTKLFMTVQLPEKIVRAISNKKRARKKATVSKV